METRIEGISRSPLSAFRRWLVPPGVVLRYIWLPAQGARFSGEAAAAAAGPGGVRVVDGEPGSHQSLLVVEGCASQFEEALVVHHHPHVIKHLNHVELVHRGIEIHVIGKARASAGPHLHPKGQFWLSLLGDQFTDFVDGGGSEIDCPGWDARFDADQLFHVSCLTLEWPASRVDTSRVNRSKAQYTGPAE